jgi:glutamyl/glutaminyl-tRNA synthetase
VKDYFAALDKLRSNGHLFACPCSRKELATGKHKYSCLQGKVSFDAENVAWRVNTRDLEPITIPDLIQREGFTVDLHQAMPDFAVRRKDGRPAYQPACVVDDVLFSINTVGRGQDLLPSTAAQAVLSKWMGFGDLFERISFIHHPLVTGTNGTKLSKSAGKTEGPIIGTSVQPADFSNLLNGWLATP